MLIITKDYTLACVREASVKEFRRFKPSDVSHILVEKQNASDEFNKKNERTLIENTEKKFWLKLKSYLDVLYEYDLTKLEDDFDENTKALIKKSKKLIFYDVSKLIDYIGLESLLELWLLINPSSCLYKNGVSSLYKKRKEEVMKFLSKFIPSVIISPNQKFHGRAFVWHKNPNFMLNVYHGHIAPFFNFVSNINTPKISVNGTCITKNLALDDDKTKAYLSEMINDFIEATEDLYTLISDYQVAYECKGCQTYFIDHISRHYIHYCDNCLPNHLCEECNKTFQELITVNNRKVCQSCFDEHYVACKECGHMHHKDKMVRLNKDYICEDCYIEKYEKEYSYCYDCLSLIKKGEEIQAIAEEDGEEKEVVICPSCYNKEYEECMCCGKVFFAYNMHDVYEGILCEKCYEDNASICDGCGTEHLNKEMKWFWNGRKEVAYCSSCVEEHTFECDVCGKVKLNSEGYYLDNMDLQICDDCYSNVIEICNHCGELMLQEDNQYVEGFGNVCPHCYEELEEEIEDEEIEEEANV